ncbi:MAG: sigma-54-dependent Fis family transcriptional regulator [Burkholderiales bacterium]|nr:MAG: sigma-54-dependent Fis family transcriptional regulator [Burkholderiales bacterium]
MPPEQNRTLARGLRAPRALVVDDEADLRELLELTLVGMGLDVDCAADLASARRLLASGRYALCLTDMRLPDGDGLSLVAQIGADHPDTPVAVITAYGSAESAVAALKAGAFDYLSKPVGLDALRALVRSALSLSASAAVEVAVPPPPARAAEAPRPATARAPSFDATPAARIVPTPATPPAPAAGGLLLGVSPAIEAVRASIARLARSMAPVAITGESGSGKELAARAIHRLGSRALQPFVAVNCGAIPENLMESEFFGHKRGAFTGADQDRTGFFQAADGGTLFLDEVADLPLSMQVKLLRAIQERCVRRVGATVEEPVDVRIVSATHQDLARCVAAGRFRQDLYYRLNVIELRMPPLRERLEDVGVLAESVLVRLATRAGLPVTPRLSSVTLRYLQSYGFPGNVRELENILERALAFSNGEVVNVEDLGLRPAGREASENEPADEIGGADEDRDEADAKGVAAQAGGRAAALEGAGGGMDAAGGRPRPVDASVAPKLSDDGIPESLPDYLDAVERDAILRALERTRHNRTAAARLLGISFRALRYRMQRLGIG